MKNVLLQRAMVAVRDLLAVTPADRVLIVDDGSLSRNIVDAFDAACTALGKPAVICRYTPRMRVSPKEFGLFARASMYEDRELAPDALLAAVGAADVVVCLVSDLALLFDDRLGELIAGGGRRIGWIAYLDEDAFLRLMPVDRAEAAAVQDATQRMADRLRAARSIHVTSDAGTDLRLQVGAHAVNAGGWYGADGQGMAGVSWWPGGQVGTVPNAGSASGRLVIDRSAGAPELRPLVTPITLTVKDGYVVDVDQGREGRLLGQFLRRLGHPAAYHLTELAFGTNPACTQTGVAPPAEDTHTAGCVSLALGADVHLGGRTVGPCHVDLTMTAATLEADGEVLIRDGELVGG